MLKVIEPNASSAKENMQRDKELLENLHNSSSPILHFYHWKSPSLTYGYFVDPKKVLHLEEIQKQKIDIARRPTGGGVVFHTGDLAFSFLLPSSSEHFSKHALTNYYFVHQIVLKALKPWLQSTKVELTDQDYPIEGPFNQFFCMARPSKYDLIYEGRKIAGAAQRKTAKGYLHQGTISLLAPQKNLLKRLVKDEMVLRSILKYTSYFTEQESELLSLKKQIKNALIEEYKKYFNS